MIPFRQAFSLVQSTCVVNRNKKDGSFSRSNKIAPLDVVEEENEEEGVYAILGRVSRVCEVASNLMEKYSSSISACDKRRSQIRWTISVVGETSDCLSIDLG